MNLRIRIKILNLMTLIILSLSLLACSGDDSTGPQSEFEGTWKTACEYYQVIGAERITNLQFSADRITMKDYEYSDNSCTQLKDTTTSSGTSVFGKSLTTPSGMLAHEVDFHREGFPVMKNLIARQEDTLYLKIGLNSRPTDVVDGLKFNYDSTASAETSTESDSSSGIEPGQAPSGLKNVWYIGFYVNGNQPRFGVRVTFSDGTVTSDPTSVFSEGIEASKQNHPKSWGVWKEEDEFLYTKMGSSDSFREYNFSLKAEPGGEDERLSGCFSSFTVYGSGSSASSGASSTAWCFDKNGRFSNDSATQTSTPSGSGGGSSPEKTGRYRIDGHVIQLVYDSGTKLSTTFGVSEDDEDTTILLGSGYGRKKQK